MVNPVTPQFLESCKIHLTPPCFIASTQAWPIHFSCFILSSRGLSHWTTRTGGAQRHGVAFGLRVRQQPFGQLQGAPQGAGDPWGGRAGERQVVFPGKNGIGQWGASWSSRVSQPTDWTYVSIADKEMSTWDLTKGDACKTNPKPDNSSGFWPTWQPLQTQTENEDLTPTRMRKSDEIRPKIRDFTILHGVL